MAVMFKDTVALQMLYFLKIKIFIPLDSCQFVEYLFKGERTSKKNFELFASNLCI